jgi:hypothetical protein
MTDREPLRCNAWSFQPEDSGGSQAQLDHGLGEPPRGRGEPLRGSDRRFAAGVDSRFAAGVGPPTCSWRDLRPSGNLRFRRGRSFHLQLTPRTWLSGGHWLKNWAGTSSVFPGHSHRVEHRKH